MLHLFLNSETLVNNKSLSHLPLDTICEAIKLQCLDLLK
jgi:hypothetical protein